VAPLARNGGCHAGAVGASGSARSVIAPLAERWKVGVQRRRATVLFAKASFAIVGLDSSVTTGVL